MIGKVRRNLRERGIGGTLGLIAKRVREGYTEERLVVYYKDLSEIVEPRNTAGLEVADIGAGNLADLYALDRKRGTPEADRYFENSLKHGFHGFGAFLGGDLVGYYWWVDQDNRTPHPDEWKMGADFRLGPGDVYGASLYLLDDARGVGRAAEFLFRIETALRERGYERIWGWVDSDNRPARWLYASRGYRPTWQMTNRRLIFFRWRRAAPLADAS